LELGLLSVLEELGAGPGSLYVKSRRVVDAAADRLEVAPAYLAEVLRDLYRPWQVAMPLVAIHGDSEADLSYNECRLTPVGAMAVQAEAGHSAALPIRLINGTVYQGGRRPPFPADRVIAALLGLIDRSEMSDQELLELVGPPVFPHGCDIVGDIDGVLAGREVTLRLYPKMFVAQVEQSLVVELVDFPPQIWARDVAQWIEDHLATDEQERAEFDFERLPIREAGDISYGRMDHSNERIQLVLEDGADPSRVIAYLRHDPAHSPLRSDVPVHLGQPLAAMLRDWLAQHRDDRLPETLTRLRDAARQPAPEPITRHIIRYMPIPADAPDTTVGVPVMPGRTKIFPPALANEPLPEIITPAETALIEIRRGARLHGTVGPSRLDVDLHRFLQDGQITGTLDDRSFTATLSEKPSPDHSSLQLELTGTLDGRPIDVLAQLYPPPGRLFGYAEITGTIADDPISLRVEGANGGLGSSDTVAVEGTLGNTTVNLFGATDHRRGVIRGSIDRTEIHLRARGDHQDGTLILHGRYSGPLPIFLLAAVTLQAFM
jgi:hypothetical protein